MNVLVDTSIWALALRRRRSGLSSDERTLALELTDLIRDDRVLMVGPIRSSAHPSRHPRSWLIPRPASTPGQLSAGHRPCRSSTFSPARW